LWNCGDDYGAQPVIVPSPLDRWFFRLRVAFAGGLAGITDLSVWASFISAGATSGGQGGSSKTKPLISGECLMRLQSLPIGEDSPSAERPTASREVKS